MKIPEHYSNHIPGPHRPNTPKLDNVHGALKPEHSPDLYSLHPLVAPSEGSHVTSELTADSPLFAIGDTVHLPTDATNKDVVKWTIIGNENGRWVAKRLMDNGLYSHAFGTTDELLQFNRTKLPLSSTRELGSTPQPEQPFDKFLSGEGLAAARRILHLLSSATDEGLLQTHDTGDTVQFPASEDSTNITNWTVDLVKNGHYILYRDTPPTGGTFVFCSQSELNEHNSLPPKQRH